MINWSTTDREGSTRGVKILVYGVSGIGKTCLCATAPRPLICSAEAGLLSLKGVSIPVAKISTVEDLTEIHAWAAKSAEAKAFDTICLDSVTEIAEVVLANAKKLVRDPRQAYGELIEKMTLVIRAFRDLQDKHVYFSAKEEPFRDADGVTRYGPSMPGKALGPQLPYFFDEVFAYRTTRTKEGANYRFLQTSVDLQYVAKDRSGLLDTAELPDLGAIILKIQGVKA